MENRSTDTSDYSGEEEVKGNTFIIYWCNEGLEAVVDITQTMSDANNFEKEKIFDILKNPEGNCSNRHIHEINQMIHHMMLRGKFNPQRHYEIYSLHTTEEISKEDLERFFEDSPQTTVDFIRERGTKLYSDRAVKNNVVIV